MEHVQKDAIGVAIILTITEDAVVQDISTVTAKRLVFTKPNGSQVSKIAAFVTSGTDGRIQYVTESGFLDAVGVWMVHGYVVFPGGFDGKSEGVTFRVD